MNVFGQDVRVPLVAEASGHNVPLPGPAGTSTTVLSNVASIHAVYIDVMVTSTVRIDRIDLVLYAANGDIAATVTIHSGNVAAGTPSIHRYGGSLQALSAGPFQVGQAIGQFYDVVVRNNDAGGNNGTVNVWTAARS